MTASAGIGCRGAADLFEHDARLEEAEPGAADRLGQRDADDAGLGERGPQVAVEAVARRRATSFVRSSVVASDRILAASSRRSCWSEVKEKSISGQPSGSPA